MEIQISPKPLSARIVRADLSKEFIRPHLARFPFRDERRGKSGRRDTLQMNLCNFDTGSPRAQSTLSALQSESGMSKVETRFSKSDASPRSDRLNRDNPGERSGNTRRAVSGIITLFRSKPRYRPLTRSLAIPRNSSSILRSIVPR